VSSEPLNLLLFSFSQWQLSERVAGKKCSVPPPPMTTTARSYYESLKSHPSSLEVAISLQHKGRSLRTLKCESPLRAVTSMAPHPNQG